jgi:hypothetical protein
MGVFSRPGQAGGAGDWGVCGGPGRDRRGRHSPECQAAAVKHLTQIVVPDVRAERRGRGFD